jgi:hypothetical protein
VAPQFFAGVTVHSTKNSQETTMPLLISLTVSIGLLAVVATWLFLGPLAALNFQIWQAFMAWACFYHCGGKSEGLLKTIPCMILGALIGAVSVLIIGALSGLGSLAAPVAVGLGASAIVLAAHIPAVSTIPASVYGFAAIAGLILLKPLAPVDALLPTIGSIVIGALFGWVSEAVAGMLTKPQVEAAPSRRTAA